MPESPQVSCSMKRRGKGNSANSSRRSPGWTSSGSYFRRTTLDPHDIHLQFAIALFASPEVKRQCCEFVHDRNS